MCQFVVVVFDWKVNSWLSLKVDVEYLCKVIIEQLVVMLFVVKNGVIMLFVMFDLSKCIVLGWVDFDGNNINVLLCVDYVFVDVWLLMVEGGLLEMVCMWVFLEFKLINVLMGVGMLFGQ